MNSLLATAAAPHLDDAFELQALARSEPVFDGRAFAGVEGSTAPFASRIHLGHRLIAAGALLAGDLAIYLGVWASLLPLGSGDGLMSRTLGIICAVILTAHYLQGFYPGYRVHGYELLRRRCVVTLGVGAVACAAALLLTDGGHAPLLVALFLCGGFVLQPVARSLIRGLLRRAGAWGEDAVIVGESRTVSELTDYFTRHWQYGIRPQSAGGTAPLVLIAGGPPAREEVARRRLSFADVVMLADFPGVPVSGLRPSEIDGEIGVRLGGEPQRNAAVEALGRTFDVVTAGLAILMVLPLLIAAGIAIYACDPGPVIYRQTREGLRGRPFSVLKLRTMYQDADGRLEALLAADQAARDEWATHFKLRHDPRILPWIGSLLRETSVDELPQLVNVLTGDMRLVGPRPFPMYHLAALDGRFRARRRSVTPGLTGLWQISDRSAADLERQRHLDEFYLDNRSFWFDMHILLKTVPAVIKGEGAY